MCPEGKEYPVSWISIVVGLGAWIRFFRILIVMAVIMEVEDSKIAEYLCARDLEERWRKMDMIIARVRSARGSVVWDRMVEIWVSMLVVVMEY